MFFYLVKFFVWYDPYLLKYYSDEVFRRCIPDQEMRSVISFCHDQVCGDVLVGGRLQSKFFNVVSIGLLYLGILLSTVRVALGASSWVELVDGI